ncbi:MAG: hypothetical protein WC612_02490 [Bdellovibrionales bacterium]|jgi:hypothetical protein
MNIPMNRRKFLKYAALLAAAETLPACAKDHESDKALKLEPKPEIVATPEEFAHPVPAAERNENALYVRYAVALDEKGEPVLKDGKPVVLRDKDNNPLIDGYTTPKVKLQGDKEPRSYEVLFEEPVTIDDIRTSRTNVRIAMDPNAAGPMALTTKNQAIEYRKALVIANAVKEQLVKQVLFKSPQSDTPPSYEIDVKAVEAYINRFTIFGSKPSSLMKPQP